VVPVLPELVSIRLPPTTETDASPWAKNAGSAVPLELPVTAEKTETFAVPCAITAGGAPVIGEVIKLLPELKMIAADEEAADNATRHNASAEFDSGDAMGASLTEDVTYLDRLANAIRFVPALTITPSKAVCK
jgi:hypothetical protein